MVDIADLLKRGALVAQDPANFDTVEGLHDDEREALRNEVLHKWRQPRAMYITVILCSVGAAVQGWDQTVGFRRYQSFRDTNISDRVAMVRTFRSQSNLVFPTHLGIQTTKGTCGLLA